MVSCWFQWHVLACKIFLVQRRQYIRPKHRRPAGNLAARFREIFDAGPRGGGRGEPVVLLLLSLALCPEGGGRGPIFDLYMARAVERPGPISSGCQVVMAPGRQPRKTGVAEIVQMPWGASGMSAEKDRVAGLSPGANEFTSMGIPDLEIQRKPQGWPTLHPRGAAQSTGSPIDGQTSPNP